MCIKRSSLHLLNSPNSLNSLNSCKFAFCKCIESGESGWRMSGECIESDQNRLANVGECIESGQFSKMTILASTRIRQIRQRVAIAYLKFNPKNKLGCDTCSQFRIIWSANCHRHFNALERYSKAPIYKVLNQRAKNCHR
jgi:hypothetical protein